jgi:hypothetical protein
MKLGDFMTGLGILAIPTIGIPVLQTMEREGYFSRKFLRGLHARV